MHGQANIKFSTTIQATYDNITQRLRFACSITKATNTPSEYVILIAFPLQLRLHERTLILRYTFIACLVYLLNIHAYRTVISRVVMHRSNSAVFCGKGYENTLQNCELFHKERAVISV